MIRLMLLLCISAGFSYFDIFNRRNIPQWYAYGAAFFSLLIGVSSHMPANYQFSFFIGIIFFMLGFELGHKHWPMQYLNRIEKHIAKADWLLLACICFLVPFQPYPIPLHIAEPWPFVTAVLPASLLAFGFWLIVRLVSKPMPRHIAGTPFIFIGIIISLLFGNLLLLIINNINTLW